MADVDQAFGDIEPDRAAKMAIGTGRTSEVAGAVNDNGLVETIEQIKQVETMAMKHVGGVEGTNHLSADEASLPYLRTLIAALTTSPRAVEGIGAVACTQESINLVLAHLVRICGTTRITSQIASRSQGVEPLFAPADDDEDDMLEIISAPLQRALVQVRRIHICHVRS